MKSSLFYFIFGGLVITIVLQAVLFASNGIQANAVQKQLTDINQKFDKLQNSLNDSQKIITKINSFIDEPLPTDSSTETPIDPKDLLSPENLNKTLN